MEPRPKVDRFTRCHLESKRFRTKETQVPDPFSSSVIEDPFYYYDRMVKGFQWDFITSKSSWASWPVKNMIHMAVESYTTMLTDNEPLMSITPREESDTEMADIIKKAVEFWYELEAMQVKVALGVKSSRIYNVGWLQTYRDSDHPHTGIRVVAAEHVWVDPDCTVENFDPNWTILEYRGSVGDLKARYPKPVDGTWDDFDHKWKSGLSYSERVERARYEDNNNPSLTCAVYEFWFKDGTRIEWDDEESIPGRKVKKSKKKYPGGVKMIVAGGIVLSEEANPYDHHECDLTPIHCYPIPGQFYGMGDVQNLLSIQTMRNRMSQFIFDQTVKSGGGKILVGQMSGIDPNKINNAPLQVLPCRDVNQLRIVAPPTPSRHVFDYIGLLDNDGQDVMGLHDISQGATLPSHTTAQAIAVMSQSDRTRVRMASRWLTWALRRVMRQVLSNWAQYPDFKWMLTISGKDEVPDSESDTGSSIPEVEYREFDPKALRSKFNNKRLAYDIVIADTSTLPALQQDKANQVSMLLQMQVITPDEVLKFKLIDVPHADAILAARAAAPPPQPVDSGMPVPETPPTGSLPTEAVQPVPQQMQPQGEMDPEAFFEQIAMQAGEMGVTPDQLIQMMLEQAGMGTGDPNAVL